MRTYSHAVITYVALRMRDHTRKDAALASFGATLPDLPAGLGAAWLWTKKHSASREDFDIEVCGRDKFRVPDTAMHSFPVILAMFLVSRKSAAGRAFLLGWAGHLITDFLTHSSDARPQLWPVSEWRFGSPVSYRERHRYGRTFTSIEHSILAATVVYVLVTSRNSPDTEESENRHDDRIRC